MKTPSPRFRNLSARRLRSQPRRLRRLLFEQFEDRRVLATAEDDSFSFFSSQTFNGNTWLNDDYQWSHTNSVYNDETQEWEHDTQYAMGWINSPPSFAASFNTSPEGYFQYTAQAGFSGTDSFTYTICDVSGCDSATATLTVTIEPPPPIAAPDSYTVAAGSSLIVPAAEGLLDNDSSPSGQLLSAAVVTTTGHGSLALNSDGGFTYVPAPDFMGTDSFVYSISDGLHTASATVTLVVVDESPTLNEIPSPMSIDEDSGVQTIHLSGISASGGTNQTLTVTATSSLSSLIPNPTVNYTSPSATGSLSYTPLANKSGTATIWVGVHDGGPASIFRTFNVTINPVNDAPVLSGANNFTPIAANQTNNSGNLVSALIAGKLTDVDSGAVNGIVVTGLSAGTGTWEYSLNHGATWTSVGTVSIASGLLLRSTDRLRFVPGGLSTAIASVTMRAWDQTTGAPGAKVDVSVHGGATAFSAASATSVITATAVLDGFDVAINGFYSDGVNLKVQYFVAGGPTPSFKIGIYASSDGETPGQLLQFVNGSVFQGFYVQTISAAFPNLPEDYYLVAKLDSELGVAEVNENNNLARFAGGSFLNHQPGGQTILEVHGTDANDPISVSTYTYDVSHTEQRLLEPERWEDPVIDEELIIEPECVANCYIEDELQNFPYEDENGVLQDNYILVPVDRGTYEPPETVYLEGWCSWDPCVTRYVPAVYEDVTYTTTHTAWRVVSAQSHVGVPSGASGPPYYDVSGNGIVDPFDAAAAYASNFNWKNQANPFDVDLDGVPTAADALEIINLLNATGEQIFSGFPTPGDLRLDATGDGYLSVLDAKAVMDKLNGGSGQVSAPWRNQNTPGDVNGNGHLDADDAQAVMDYLAVHQIDYTEIAIDQIRIRAHGGHDVVRADGAPASIYGGADDDSLTGGTAADILIGGDGADLLNGGNGTDSLWGNAGHDLLFGGLGNDALEGGAGNDVMFGNAGSSLLPGGLGGEGEGEAEGEGGDSDNDGLNGGPGDDGLYGDEGDDSLTGGPGNDIARGGGQAGDYSPDEDCCEFLDLLAYPIQMAPCNVLAPNPHYTFASPGVAIEGQPLSLQHGFYISHPTGGAGARYPLDLNVKVEVIPGTAHPGEDYVSPSTFIDRVPGAYMSPNEPHVIPKIPIRLDTLLEHTETFTIRRRIVEYPNCGVTEHVVSIYDRTIVAEDDEAQVLLDTPRVLWNLTGNDRVGPDNTPFPTIASLDGSAIEEFTQPEHGTVAWDTGTQVSYSRLIYTPNAGYIGDDSFTYTIYAGVNINLPGFERLPTTATVDLSVGPTVNIADASHVDESGPENEPTTARFRVWLSEPMDHVVHVDFETTNLVPPETGDPEDRARARSGFDFEEYGQHLVFTAGQTEKFIDVPILDDDIDEYTELLGAKLRNPIGISSGQTSATGAIIDDDDEPELSIADVTVIEPTEGIAPAQLTVTLSRMTEKEASVDIASQEIGTPNPEEHDSTNDDVHPATSDIDFENTEETIPIPANVLSFPVSVMILANGGNDWPKEAFAVALLQAENAVPIGTPGRVTIINAAASTTRGDLIAYEPLTSHLKSNSIRDTPGVNTSVSIRRNSDDDNENGIPDLATNETNVANENDLITIAVQFSIPIANVVQNGWTIEFRRSNEAIQLWQTSNKTVPFFAAGADRVAATPQAPGNLAYLDVEWKSTDAAVTSSNLELWVTAPNQEVFVDRLTFKPSKSAVIIFNGEGQTAGSIGNPNNGTPPDGTTVIAQILRSQGYDTYIFDEDDVGYDSPFTWVQHAFADVITPDYAPGNGPAAPFASYNEIVNAVKRGITDIAIIGYSHGGGAEYVLSEVIHHAVANGLLNVNLAFTAYIDAVAKQSALAEKRRPVDSDFHLNLWQSGPGNIAPDVQLVQGGYLQNPAAGDIEDNVDSADDGGLAYVAPLYDRLHTNRLAVGGRRGIVESREVLNKVIDNLKAKINR
jgi:hypothetical protein